MRKKGQDASTEKGTGKERGKYTEWVIGAISFAAWQNRVEENAARMANSLKLLTKGVKYWNRYRAKNPDFVPCFRYLNLGWIIKDPPEFAGANLAGADMEGICLTGQYLAEADLTGANLRGAQLTELSLQDAILDNAVLDGANLSESIIDGASFTGASLIRTDISYVEMYSTCFRYANLQGANLMRSIGTHVRATGADLSNANFSGAELPHTDFSGADLRHAVLVGARLQGSNFEGARIYGVSAWDTDLTDANQSGLIFSKADEKNELTMHIDDMEIAHMIQLLMNEKKLPGVLNALAERIVLVLGSYRGGKMKTSRAIADRLRKLGYFPLIYDLDRPECHHRRGTLSLLAGLSRFVILDVGSPDLPRDMPITISFHTVPWVLIRKKKCPPCPAIEAITNCSRVLMPIVEFSNAKELGAMMSTHIVQPAEEAIIGFFEKDVLQT